MDPKAETVEDLLARRKNLHMGMLKHAREDLALKLQAAFDAFVVTPPHPVCRSLLLEPRNSDAGIGCISKPRI